MLLELYDENQRASARGEPPPLTLIIVTHELNEALYVGDRIVGLSPFWDWSIEGHTHWPGATIVYDQEAPIFELKSSRDFELFNGQRQEIRRIVFEPATPANRHEHVRYWSQQVPDGSAP
jgi:ABC-type taurine transport system ATPase subunit